MVRPLIKNVYNIRVNLLELLGKTDEIENAYNFLDDLYGNHNMNNHFVLNTMNELKMDMLGFANDICSEINKIDGVRNSNTDRISPYSGMSTYINVNFNKPNDSEYLQTHKGDYSIKIRLSDHFDNSNGLEDYDIDVVGKNFYQFQQDIIDLVEQHKHFLDNLYAGWQQTHTTTDMQRYRNRQRGIKHSRARNRGNRRRQNNS